mgnify:CR=1 FL=1
MADVGKESEALIKRDLYPRARKAWANKVGNYRQGARGPSGHGPDDRKDAG